MKYGIAVRCEECGRFKKPIGRDSMDNGLCNHECPGYRNKPFAGCLWPGESEKDFGYPVGLDGWEDK